MGIAADGVGHAWSRVTGACQSIVPSATKAIQQRAKLVGRFHTGPADGWLKRTSHEDRSVDSTVPASQGMAHVIVCSLSALREVLCMREACAQTVNHDAH